MSSKIIKKTKYFVIDFKKIKTPEQYKNVIVGHNNRKRNYLNRVNINTSKSKNNIILTDLNFKDENEILDYAKNNLAKGKRQIRKNSAKSFSIVVDCSVMEGWTEKDYIKYLEEADKWFKKRFKGQEIISSVIHLDESKPHLHISFSYFNKEEGAWIQKNLYQQGKTDLNKILADFEKEIGQKYGLKRGDNVKLKKILLKNTKEVLQEKGKYYTIKSGFMETEKKFMFDIDTINEVMNNYKNKIISYVKKVGEQERAGETIAKLKQKHEQEKKN